MTDDIIKLKAIYLETNNYTLKIKSLDRTDENLFSYYINPEEKFWNSKNDSIAKNCIEKRITDKEINTYSERKGIWLSKSKKIFFSHISIFEENEYLFKFKKKTQINLNEELTNYLKDFFYYPQKWIESVIAEGRNDDNNKFQINLGDNKGREKRKIFIKRIKRNKFIINFKEYTGKLGIKKEIIGDDLNDIEVVTRKLSKENYFDMLTGLTAFIGQVIFKYSTPTEILATREYITTPIKMEKLYDFPKYVLLNKIMKELP